MNVVAAQQQRVPVLGIDPELVLVLESNRQIQPEDVQRAGLEILEIRSDKVLVTFSSDPEMTEFRSSCKQYGLGPRGTTAGGNERPAEYEALFDALEQVRELSEQDVIDPRIEAQLGGAEITLRLDVSCWCPDDADEARRRFEEVNAAVASAGGAVLDKSFRWESGLSLIRAQIPSTGVRELARLDRVRRIIPLPMPQLSLPEVLHRQPSELPPIVAPANDGPILGVIDSGVASSHPLIAPAVFAIDWVGGLGDGGDRSGHGTLVASLGLYGSLEDSLADKSQAMKAIGRLVSVRVLDDQNNFPNDRLWEAQLLEAMEVAVQAGARVINLSLGDLRFPYKAPRPTALGAMIDQFIRVNDVIVVISTGNYLPLSDQIKDLINGNYPKLLLEADDSGLLDPAPSALALTVGALCPDHGQGAMPLRDDVDVVPIGSPGMPSPLTRVGPGPMRMIKPELAAPGGSLSVDMLASSVSSRDFSTQVVGAGIGGTSQLLAMGAGTSFAAPLVSNAALRILNRYPQLSANGVRALLLCSVQPTDVIIDGLGEAGNLEQQNRLTGYGRVSGPHAEASDDHRVMLLAEGLIQIDDVHLYAVPIPSSFFGPGGTRRFSIALSYSPGVRPTRLDYLASHMEVHAYWGVSLDFVGTAYTRQQKGDDEVPEELAQFRMNLQPGSTRRGKGANQFCFREFRQKLNGEKGNQFIVAVKNTNRWNTPGEEQPYALAVMLERDYDHAPLYLELRASLEAIVEVEIEAEVEV